jgi:hypothetical protein
MRQAQGLYVQAQGLSRNLAELFTLDIGTSIGKWDEERVDPIRRFFLETCVLTHGSGSGI